MLRPALPPDNFFFFHNLVNQQHAQVRAPTRQFVVFFFFSTLINQQHASSDPLPPGIFFFFNLITQLRTQIRAQARSLAQHLFLMECLFIYFFMCNLCTHAKPNIRSKKHGTYQKSEDRFCKAGSGFIHEYGFSVPGTCSPNLSCIFFEIDTTVFWHTCTKQEPHVIHGCSI